MFLIGLAAALLASVLFNVGVALQALEARATPPVLSLRLGLLGRLLRRPRWVLGLALGGLGVAPQVLAFKDAPFVVVQPALAAGLVLLLLIGSRALGERVGLPEVVGVGAIIGGGRTSRLGGTAAQRGSPRLAGRSRRRHRARRGRLGALSAPGRAA